MSDKDLRPNDEPSSNQKMDNSIEGSRRQNTRMIIWGVAGAYLLYLAVKMMKDYMGGLVEGQGTKIMVIVSSIVFTLAAIFLLVQCIRYAIHYFKASVNNMVAAQEELDQTDEDAQETTDEDPKED